MPIHVVHKQRPWIVVVEPLKPDFWSSSRPIGVEITAPTGVPLDRLNRLLADLGETPLNEHDYLPMRAA
jgi:hypothetical protein